MKINIEDIKLDMKLNKYKRLVKYGVYFNRFAP